MYQPSAADYKAKSHHQWVILGDSLLTPHYCDRFTGTQHEQHHLVSVAAECKPTPLWSPLSDSPDPYHAAKIVEQVLCIHLSQPYTIIFCCHCQYKILKGPLCFLHSCLNPLLELMNFAFLHCLHSSAGFQAQWELPLTQKTMAVTTAGTTVFWMAWRESWMLLEPCAGLCCLMRIYPAPPPQTECIFPAVTVTLLQPLQAWCLDACPEILITEPSEPNTQPRVDQSSPTKYHPMFLFHLLLRLILSR